LPRKLTPLGPKTLRLTRTAEADFDGIVDYINDEAGSETALRFAEKLDAELAKRAALGRGGVPR
jgi:plasmid stabilization system protein ParE